MTSTLDAIQERLDPEVIAEHAKDTAQDVTDYAIREAREIAREIIDHARVQATEAVRDVTGQATLALREATIGRVERMARNATDTAGGLRHTVVETIRTNPMPAILVGLGLGWMLLNRPSGSSSLHGAAANAAQHPAGHVAIRAQETVGQVADQVQGTAGHLIDQVQGTADPPRRAQRGGGRRHHHPDVGLLFVADSSEQCSPSSLSVGTSQTHQ